MRKETYTVCIADDEILIQKSMAARLLASGKPLRLAGFAETAESAKTLYWETKPDIFFVDINMPGMDGLHLIKNIRSEDPACATQFIIITGYDDMPHIREAFHNSVTDYLKKPISIEDLLQALAACERAILEEEKNSSDIAFSVPMLCTDIDDEFASPSKQQCTGTVFALYAPTEPAIVRALNEVYRIGEAAGSTANVCCFSARNVPNLRLYFMQEALPAPKNWYDNTMTLVYAYPENENFESVIERLEQTMPLRFFRSGLYKAVMQPVQKKPDLGVLDYLLEHGEEAAARKTMSEYLTNTLKNDKAILALPRLYREIMLLFINKHIVHNIPVPSYLNNALSHFALCAYPSARVLEDRLQAMAVSLAQKIGDEQRPGGLVQSICEYLKQNYCQDITLSETANRFYVSPQYLSRSFHEKTGVSFIQYLEHIRMEKACEYLSHSRSSITEICEQVGYMDSAYFAKVFRKNYGISPGDYRSQTCPEIFS